MQYRNRRSVISLLGAAALFSPLTLGNLPAAEAQIRSNSAYLDAGTVIPVSLDTQLSSRDSRPGDTFTAAIRSDNSHNYNLPTDAEIEGVVRSAQPYRDDKNPGTLDLDFRRIRFADGRSIAIQGSLIGLDSKSVEKRNGRLVAKAGHTTNRLTYVGYGAGAGLLVSLFTKSTLRDTIIGGGLGYLFGALQKSGNARDVTLGPGTKFGVRLDRSVSLTSYDNGGGFPNNNYRHSGDGGGLPTNNGSNGNFQNGGLPGTGNQNNNRQDGLPGDYNREDNNNSGQRHGGLPTDARQGNNLLGNNGGGLPPGSGSTMGASNITVLLNGRALAFNGTQKPVMRNGEVLLPARAVLQSAGIPFRYNSVSRELQVQSNGNAARLALDSNQVSMGNGRVIRLSSPAQTINGTFYVPMRFFGLVTGQEANYNASRRIVTLNTSHNASDAEDTRNNTGGLPPR